MEVEEEAQHRHGEEAEEEDYLSALPDAILIQILSLVPTKVAVRTSILASRWRHLWLSLPDLAFQESNEEEEEEEEAAAASLSFSDIVQDVLLRHDYSVPLRRLCIHGTTYFPLYRLPAWLGPAHSLQFLSLFLPQGLDCIPSLPSLQHLSLCAKFWDICANLPLRLPKLRVLCISGVDLLNQDNEKALEDLIASCSALDTLSVNGCYFDALRIQASVLETLRFHHCDYNDVVVTVRAPRLRFLNQRSDVMERFSLLGEMPELEDALFDFGAYSWACNMELVLEALHGLSHARTLTLIDLIILFLPCFGAEVQRIPISRMPIFHNLRYLRLIYPMRRESFFWSVTSLLKHTPNLEMLRIEEATLHVHEQHPQPHIMNVLPPDLFARMMKFEEHQCVNEYDCLCNKWEFFFDRRNH